MVKFVTAMLKYNV